MKNSKCLVVFQNKIDDWTTCRKKAEDLGLEIVGRHSVPPDVGALVDVRARTYCETGPVSDDRCQNISVADFLDWKRVLTEEQALKAFGEMYETYDAVPFLELLADNFHYSSQWVFDEFDSKDRYERYITRKLKSIKEAECPVSSRIGVWRDRPCMVLKQRGGKSATVLTKVVRGHVTDIAMCLVPTPSEVKFDYEKYIVQ